MNTATGSTRDAQGFDANGFRASGYDRQGFNEEGFNRQGNDKDGYDKNGVDRDGYDREGNKPWRLENVFDGIRDWISDKVDSFHAATSLTKEIDWNADKDWGRDWIDSAYDASNRDWEGDKGDRI